MAQTRPYAHSSGWITTSYHRAIAIPVVAFVGALLSDWAYSKSANVMWSNGSGWLLLIGLVGCGLALMLLSLATRDAEQAERRWVPVAVLFGGFAVEIVNFMVHMRDGWTAVVPTGILLSLIGAAIILVAAWLSRTTGGEVRS